MEIVSGILGVFYLFLIMPVGMMGVAIIEKTGSPFVDEKEFHAEKDFVIKNDTHYYLRMSEDEMVCVGYVDKESDEIRIKKSEKFILKNIDYIDGSQDFSFGLNEKWFISYNEKDIHIIIEEKSGLATKETLDIIQKDCEIINSF